MSPASGGRSRLDLEEARRLYVGGATCQQIADAFALSRSYVSARLRRAGTRMRPTGRPRDRHLLDVARLVRLRRAGATWDELAHDFGVSRYAVRRLYLRSSTSEREDLWPEDAGRA